MDSKHRSKKISIFVAVSILLIGILIGGYLVLKSGRGTASQLDAILGGGNFAAETCQPDPNDSNKDSDSDGLKDWQEMQIYKSDPCKTDSDGDGYLDGEEVASGYDPAKKAPEDELPGTTHKNPRELPENLTEALRQALSEQIAQNNISAFNEKGDLLSSDQLANYPAIQASIQDIIAGSGNLFTPEKIDESQIKTIPDNSRQAIQNYAAAANASFSYPKTQSGSETEMFLNAIENNDFSELELHLQSYKNAYGRLKELTVPNELVSIHKEQLEIFSKLIKIYEAIKEINTDPLKANLALQAYQTATEQFLGWLQKLSEFIQAHP